MCLTVYTHLNICGVPNVYVFAHSPNIDLTLGRPVEGSYFACIELICLSGLTVDALAYTGLEYIGTYSLDKKMWCLCRWRFLLIRLFLFVVAVFVNLDFQDCW